MPWFIHLHQNLNDTFIPQQFSTKQTHHDFHCRHVSNIDACKLVFLFLWRNPARRKHTESTAFQSYLHLIWKTVWKNRRSKMSQELWVSIDRYQYQNDLQITLDCKLSHSDIKISRLSEKSFVLFLAASWPKQRLLRHLTYSTLKFMRWTCGKSKRLVTKKGKNVC